MAATSWRPRLRPRLQQVLDDHPERNGCFVVVVAAFGGIPWAWRGVGEGMAPWDMDAAAAAVGGNDVVVMVAIVVGVVAMLVWHCEA